VSKLFLSLVLLSSLILALSTNAAERVYDTAKANLIAESFVNGIYAERLQKLSVENRDQSIVRFPMTRDPSMTGDTYVYRAILNTPEYNCGGIIYVDAPSLIPELASSIDCEPQK